MSWEPDGGVTVTFHTYSRYIQVGLYRHTDRYDGQGLCFRPSKALIASAGMGYVC